MRERARLAAVAGLFILSGASALTYQVAWQRILAFSTGMGIDSVAIIVAAFMVGLGIGSHSGGVLSSRMSRRGALRAFAIIELSVALLASLSCHVYYDLLYRKAPWLYSTLAHSTGAHLVTLLPPTLLMGMSLPFLVRAMVGQGAAASRTIGFLYGANVLGAGLGALITPWLLIRHLGVVGAVWVGVLGNATAGLGAFLLGGGLDRAGADATSPEAPFERPPGPPLSVWVLLYGLSGFVALSLEIVWFRIVDVAVKSTAFTFGTVLALYLLGNAAGALFGAAYAPRVRRPLGLFLQLQCAILIYVAVAMLVGLAIPTNLPLVRWFSAYFAEYDGFRLGRVNDPTAVLRLYVLLPVVLFAIPTVLMGLSFPVLQRAVQDDPRTSGRKVGLLQAVNTAGCVGGTLLVGLLGLRLLGSMGSLRVLMALGLLFAVVGLRLDGRRRFGVLAAALLLAVALLPSGDRLWRRLHGSPAGPAFFGEDATGVVAITPEPRDQWRMSVNGRGNSTFPYGGLHSWLGAIPAVMHEAPLDVAIIGLGSGDTAWAAACRAETRQVVVFEISSPQLRLLETLAAIPNPPPRVARLLSDPRIRVRIADGRNALDREGTQYDLIEMDALFPYSAFSGNLYSREFLEICARRLRPRGLMCAWAPTSRSHATFRAVFPHVADFGGNRILVGSLTPFTLDRQAWLERLQAPHVRAHLRPQVAAEVAAGIETARAEPWEPPSGTLPNRDLFPRDEFATPLL